LLLEDLEIEEVTMTKDCGAAGGTWDSMAKTCIGAQ